MSPTFRSLRQAFHDGVDIHAMTASEMFNVPVKGMDPMVRRQAKAINFGIIYGISGFGLARQLSIPREEAAAYIKKYFQKFPGIQDYMEEYRAFAREHGYVSTIFGRKVWLPQIKSPNPRRALLRRTPGDQRPAAGLGRRHHQARHDPHAGRPQGRRPQVEDAAPGPRRTRLRGAREGSEEADGGGHRHDGPRHPARRSSSTCRWSSKPTPRKTWAEAH